MFITFGELDLDPTLGHKRDQRDYLEQTLHFKINKSDGCH